MNTYNNQNYQTQNTEMGSKSTFREEYNPIVMNNISDVVSQIEQGKIHKKKNLVLKV